MLLHRMQDRGQPVTVKLVMGARNLPDAPSRNVVAELRGREKPDEVVVIGGHIDSWDVGQGAMDDGGRRGGGVGGGAPDEGARPHAPANDSRRRMDERGERRRRRQGIPRDARRGELDKHVFALESDNGVFRPYGIAAVGTDSALAMLRRIAPLLSRIGADSVTRGEGEADIAPLLESGVPGAGLVRRRLALLLVPPHRRRHPRQARPARRRPMRGGVRRVCVCAGGDAGGAAENPVSW